MIDHPVRVPLPDGVMVNCEIVITSYFDDQGQLKYGVELTGSPNLAQAIGLLELSKQSVYDIYKEDEPFPPDSDEEDDDDDEEEL